MDAKGGCKGAWTVSHLFGQWRFHGLRAIPTALSAGHVVDFGAVGESILTNPLGKTMLTASK
jgi:hypothetical protein